MNSTKADSDKPPYKRANILLRLLGPGLVTGAADDDPSGIATYSQAGAQFGYGLLWTVFLTTPFMITIQLVSAQIGRVTGKRIIANVKDFAPRWLVTSLVAMLVMANTFNIATDLAAMGESLSLVIGGLNHEHALIFAAASVLLQVFVRYRRYAPALKFLTLVLFLCVATASPSTFRGAKRLRAQCGRLPRLTAIICSWSPRCSGRRSVRTSSSGKHPRRWKG
jgi:NRAMP (natural resistance-associated macrophage protein)-like metal ion transporter